MFKKMYIFIGIFVLILLTGFSCSIKKEIKNTVPLNYSEVTESEEQNIAEEVTKELPENSQINFSEVIESEEQNIAEEVTKELPENSHNEKVEVAEKQVVKEKEPELIKTETKPIKVVVPEFTKCTTINCFTELAKNCQKGDFTLYTSGPFLFDSTLTVQSIIYYKINGKNSDGLCEFTYQILNSLFSISDENKAEIVANGTLTEEEINEQLKIMNESINEAKLISNCTGVGTDFATLIMNMANWNTSSSCKINLGSNQSTCILEPNITCISNNEAL
ncbi:MAG TPA: hypothetical protein PK831_03475 [Candidatus Magasanikbacteria bacterium]|nr:hypothetical protein [Candidatus Magasanikbacteria bacterium]